MKTPAPALEPADLQGLLASGYGKHPAASFLALRITDPAAAARWLARLLPRVTTGADRDAASKLNLALSFRGVAKLLPADAELGAFSREFREGMATPHRQRVLGDLAGGPSDPANWSWGGPRQPVDLLLAVYERDAAALHSSLAQLRGAWAGVELVRELPAISLADGREHFGFRDGFAQPSIRGLGRPGAERDLVAPGEFILGQPDNSGDVEPAPAWARNGSYLVVRQITQDVPAFWRAFGALPDAEKVALAAKMVGRWPDGTPLTLETWPVHAPNPTNDFGYHASDAAGLRCPFSAHVRRANPRDALTDDPAESLRLVNRHRLLRRGRAFGRPLAPENYPPGCAVSAAEGVGAPEEPRGLYFACLNASLSRQFEFVQQTWLNNPKFHGLVNAADPITAQSRWAAPGETAVFPAAAEPVRRRVAWAQTFVATVGGEYFFLPGIAGLRRLVRAE